MESRNRKRILVLRYRFIGDTILTIPFLRNLRRAEPEAEIVWVVAPGSSDVVHGVPYVDELLYWDPVTIHADSRGAHKTLSSKWSFIKYLRRMRFDKVYVLKRSLSSAIIARLTGAPERIGFDTEARGFLLTKRVPYRHDQHEVQNFLDVLRADGVSITDDYLEAWLTEEEKEFATDYLESAGVTKSDTLIALHPFTANPPRAWHQENFIELANRLQMLYNAKVLIFGGKRDAPMADKLRNGISPAPIMAVGTTTLRQSMALLGLCRMLVCNDSGIMHLAAAMRVPLVALFGPQSPVKFGPWGEKCRIIYKAFPCSPCRQRFFSECEPSARMKPACIEDISIDDVLRESMNLMSEIPGN
ncbi:MAG: lipopolysaccharide heptosyltransferase II [Geobacteraceae bacterium]|nr:lipopolysaccharide heptosyltransferase II [Geobacteraceae bacterium]